MSASAAKPEFRIVNLVKWTSLDDFISVAKRQTETLVFRRRTSETGSGTARITCPAYHRSSHFRVRFNQTPRYLALEVEVRRGNAWVSILRLCNHHVAQYGDDAFTCTCTGHLVVNGEPYEKRRIVSCPALFGRLHRPDLDETDLETFLVLALQTVNIHPTLPPMRMERTSPTIEDAA